MFSVFFTFLIHFYRKYLRGKFIFRGMKCTFSKGESCSAYGLRMARNISNPFSYVLAIRERLKLCRMASLVFSSEKVFSDPFYEKSPLQIARSLRSRNERWSTIYGVIRQKFWLLNNMKSLSILNWKRWKQKILTGTKLINRNVRVFDLIDKSRYLSQKRSLNIAPSRNCRQID